MVRTMFISFLDNKKYVPGRHFTWTDASISMKLISILRKDSLSSPSEQRGTLKRARDAYKALMEFPTHLSFEDKNNLLKYARYEYSKLVDIIDRVELSDTQRIFCSELDLCINECFHDVNKSLQEEKNIALLLCQMANK